MMRRQIRGLYQLLILVGCMILLIRFFPHVIRLGEGAALSVGRFWWAILVVALVAWLVWVLRKRNSG